ncbi:MAG: Zn-ribbon domain-containing OB-fold protein [Tepidiformaceae bacterium]
MASSTTDAYLPAGLPAPAPSIDGLDDEFWSAAKRNELVVQKCNSCGNFQSTEWICYKCHSFDLGWAKVSGKGKIFSWERIWHPVHPALKDACPYVAVLVELPDAGNVRLVGNLLGDPREEVVIGSDVEAVFEHHGTAIEVVNDLETNMPSAAGNEYTLVQWKRA